MGLPLPLPLHPPDTWNADVLAGAGAASLDDSGALRRQRSHTEVSSAPHCKGLPTLLWDPWTYG